MRAASSGVPCRGSAEPTGAPLAASRPIRERIEAVESIEATNEGEVIKAKAANRSIEVQFESLTPKTTRMRVTADSDGLFKDSATATEIILQTERVLPAT